MRTFKLAAVFAIIPAAVILSASQAMADPFFTPLLIGGLGLAGITGGPATLIATIASAVIVTGRGRDILVLM